ncbi:MAG: biopolymer transporter ExbD [Planctomycetes bacterium]|nr:biopolymer transporter ExbD [Planctomycetota bacterium]
MHPAALADDNDVKPDMTAMIDCVFLMIVFFICLDFRSLEAKLPAWLPRDHGAARKPMEPLEQLSIRIVCDRFGEREHQATHPTSGRPRRHRLQDHRVHFEVGATVCATIADLQHELARIGADPGLRVPDREQPGASKRLPVVIEPLTGAVYDDAVRVADLARHVGFDDITFGAGRGALAPR